MIDLAKITELIALIANIPDPQRMLQAVVDLSRDRFNLNHAVIYRLTDNKTGLTLAVISPDTEHQLVTDEWHISCDDPKSMIAQVAITQQGILNQPKVATSLLSTLAKNHSQLIVPLTIGDRLLGVLALKSAEAYQFTAEDLQVQTVFANQVALLWHNANLQSQLTQTQTEISGLTTQLENLRFSLDQHAIVSRSTLEGVIVDVNDKFCEISKYSRQQLIGQRYNLFNSNYHDTDFFEEMWCTLLDGQIWHGELNNKTKDGHSYWLKATMVPIFDASQTLAEFITISTDITTYMYTKIEQEVAQKRASILLEVIPDLIGIADADGHLLYLNPAGYRMLKFSDETQLVDLTFYQFLPQWATDLMINEAIPTALQARYWAGESALLNEKQQEIPTFQIVIVQQKKDGSIDFVATIARDMSEIKDAQHEQKRLLSELELTYRRYVNQEWSEFLTEYQSLLEKVAYDNPEYPTLATPTITDIDLAQKNVMAQGQNTTIINEEGRTLITPISLRGQVIGTMNLQDNMVQRDWTANETALIEAISEQLSLTLENLRLFEETKQRANREKIIADMTQQIWASGEIEQVMETAISQLGAKLDATKVVIRLGTEAELQRSS